MKKYIFFSCPTFAYLRNKIINHVSLYVDLHNFNEVLILRRR